MIMITLEVLKAALDKEFHAAFRLDEVRPGIYQVFLPAYYPDGDMIDIFLKPMKDGHIMVCDMGLTLMRLSYTYDLNTDKKKKIFNEILHSEGADIENGNIFIVAAPTAMYAAVMQFTQLIAKVADMKRYQKLFSQSQFYENFEKFVFDTFSAYHPQKDVMPIKGRGEVKVDYVLQNEKQRPVYLYPVRGTERARLVVISLLNLQRENMLFTGVVVHEDFESLPTTTQKFITNAADKQFTDFLQYRTDSEQYMRRIIA